MILSCDFCPFAQSSTGAQIRRLCRSHGVKYPQLARHLGYSVSYVEKLIYNERPLSLALYTSIITAIVQISPSRPQSIAS